MRRGRAPIWLEVLQFGLGIALLGVSLQNGRWLFVAPDNGLLTPVLEAHPQARVHLVASPLDEGCCFVRQDA